MTPNELAAAGRVLYGERWQAPLTHDLGFINDRPLRRWLSGRLPVPDGVKLELRQLLIKRYREIGAIIGYTLNRIDRSVLHCPTKALFRYDDDGEVALVHAGWMQHNDIASVTDGAREIVRQEYEREKEEAKTFVRETTWWLTHSSGHPVRAPGHVRHLYKGYHGWTVPFGANSFLVGKAIARCKSVLNECREEAAAGEIVPRARIEDRLRNAISGSVANVNGEEYGRYPIKDDLLVFGAQAIAVDDGVKLMINKTNLWWDDGHLEIPSSAAAAPDVSPIENLPFNPALLLTVDELELSVRSDSCLKNEGIAYLGDLVQKTEHEMRSLPNFGFRSLTEVRQVLAERGLQFGMDLPGWPPNDIGELARAYSAQLDAANASP
jgi:hypothetical protein